MSEDLPNAPIIAGQGATAPNFELVIVGTFPDARYFSITNDDMHYSNAQHLADFTIDPVGSPGDSYSNPFTTIVNGYTSGQWYLAPVSLGAIPVPTNSACKIDPFEGDNLLDATQRHTSADWNTVIQGSENGEPPSGTHIVDTPLHLSAGGTDADGENMAGEIVVRTYLVSNTLFTHPYVILRDVASGCAYYNPLILAHQQRVP
jgi:hypothetical protein